MQQRRLATEAFGTSQQQPPRKRRRIIRHRYPYTPSMLSADIIQHITSFTQPITELYREVVDDTTDGEVAFTVRDLYGYLRGDPTRSYFLWPGKIVLELADHRDLILLTQIVSSRDYDRITIKSMTLSGRDKYPLGRRVLQRAIPFFARTRNLYISRYIPEWMINYLQYFTSLRHLNVGVVHSVMNIRRAYDLFTSTAFATLPITSLYADTTTQIHHIIAQEQESEERLEGAEDMIVEEPKFIHSEKCFLLPSAARQGQLMTTTWPHTPLSLLPTVRSSPLTTTVPPIIIPGALMTTQTTSPQTLHLARQQNIDECGLFGAIVTAIGHNPRIHTLELHGMVIPVWDFSNKHGIEPWRHLKSLTLTMAENVDEAVRAFFLLQLPQLEEYNESTMSGELQISDTLKDILERTTVSKIYFMDEITNDEDEILFDLFPIRAIKMLNWEHAKAYDFDVGEALKPDISESLNVEERQIIAQNMRIIEEDESELERHIYNAAKYTGREIEYSHIEENLGHSSDIVVWKVSLRLK